MDQWSASEFHAIYTQGKAKDNKTTRISLLNMSVSSAEVWNSLIYEISQTLEDDDLESLLFDGIISVGGLIESWPLSLLAFKSGNLEELFVRCLKDFREENRTSLIDMAARICELSTRLKRLEVRWTQTNAAVGE